MKNEKRILYSDFNIEEGDETDYADEFSILIDEAGTMTQVQDILAIADMGLWSGRRHGYAEVKNMKEALSIGNEDFNEIYIEDGELKKTAEHHDGTNYIVLRMWKPDTGDNQRQKLKDAIYTEDIALMEGLIDEYTDKLGHVWDELHGFASGDKS